MDSYVERFQREGGSMVMLAKGNRSKMVRSFVCASTARFMSSCSVCPVCRVAAADVDAVCVAVAGYGGVQETRRLLPGLDRRTGRHLGSELHQEG